MQVGMIHIIHMMPSGLVTLVRHCIFADSRWPTIPGRQRPAQQIRLFVCLLFPCRRLTALYY